MNPLLQLKQTTFSYGERSVIQNIDLDLHSGDFMGILGPNGSGKTTLLRLMAGVLKPQRGEIKLLGKPLKDYPPRERAKIMGMVPQEFDILFPFEAFEVVLMGRWPYLKAMAWESEEDKKMARAAMELTDSFQFAHRPVTELSGGEQERVLIARALAQNPQLLLLDEPTTHLDLEHQMRIYELLLKLNQEKKMTIVMVVHDLNFAAIACQKILLLKEGRCVKMGSPEEVMDEATLKSVFNVGVFVEKHEKTQRPFFIPKIER